MVVPPKGWLRRENPIEMDDWGYPHDYGNPHLSHSATPTWINKLFKQEKSEVEMIEPGKM